MGDAERTVKLDVREISPSGTRRPAIVVLQGQSIGMTIKLGKSSFIIGRGSTVDVVLRDDIASRQHAEVFERVAQNGIVEYYIRDLDSTNGTFLNGGKIASEQLLQDGDKIKIGEHLLKFAMLDEFEAEFQERLHQMTQRDELTGLRSRRSLFSQLDGLISRANLQANPDPVVVMMMDLDFFKRVNDGRGHLIGSETIQETGRLIRETLGNADLAARYGGEEFLAYVPGNRDRGFEVAESIRKALETNPFRASTTDLNEKMQVTISLGIACFPDDATTAIELVQKADEALYRAKLTGRNRTCIYDAAVDQPSSAAVTKDARALMYGPAEAQ